ncbi:MAG: SRPBCC family protein [Planctomycetes bacterium]|nr:SRPBCC family protein [Planctomycetota bacterium]
MLKKLLIGFVALVLLYVVGGLLMPSRWDVVRTRTISASGAKVYEAIATLSKWDLWSVWNRRRDPKCQMRYEGPATGKGARWLWKSDGELGEGSLTISESVPDRSIRYELSLVAPFAMQMQGDVQLRPTDGGTEVVWRSTGDVGNASAMMARWMNGLGLTDSMLGGEYEKSMAGLAEFVTGSGAQAVDAHLRKNK